MTYDRRLLDVARTAGLPVDSPIQPALALHCRARRAYRKRDCTSTLQTGFEFRVAEFDLAVAVQEDAEDDADGIGRNLGRDLVAGPVVVSGDGGEVVLGIVPGIWRGRSLSLVGDAEHQSAWSATSVARRSPRKVTARPR